MRYNKMSNAYMLVYIRESEIDQINLEVTAEDIAPHLRAGLEREQKEKERKRKEKLEAHMYTVVKVCCPHAWKHAHGLFGLLARLLQITTCGNKLGKIGFLTLSLLTGVTRARCPLFGGRPPRASTP